MGRRPDKTKHIAVLIVDDSPTVRQIVSSTLSNDDEIRVVGQARNGKEAVQMVGQLNPDIVTLDIAMPVMDGLEATEQIMAYHPTPIAILTSSLVGEKREYVYKALDLGALAIIPKPACLLDLDREFIEKIKLLSRVPVITHLKGRRRGVPEQVPRSVDPQAVKQKTIGIVSSTGGPDALKRILSKFPTDLPVGIIVVQHIGAGFEKDLIGWLSGYSNARLRLAEQGELIEPGVVFFAPSGSHTVVYSKNKIGLINTPPVWGHRPSGDILLASLAEHSGSKAIGVILTGMGKDGAQGIKAVHDAGGKTIAQDEKSSLIFGMPKEAIALGAVDKIADIDHIADELLRMAAA
ncbi:MAG: chemotaxis-specific protein-glutamate methyltransferase CheB [candidate division WOR-3 bacterium]|nr:MAG: chemotaxis-specific protein-glutamate methyltransferase CheB [candidate division WOR-3 bacterium]